MPSRYKIFAARVERRKNRAARKRHGASAKRGHSITLFHGTSVTLPGPGGTFYPPHGTTIIFDRICNTVSSWDDIYRSDNASEIAFQGKTIIPSGGTHVIVGSRCVIVPPPGKCIVLPDGYAIHFSVTLPSGTTLGTGRVARQPLKRQILKTPVSFKVDQFIRGNITTPNDQVVAVPRGSGITLGPGGKTDGVIVLQRPMMLPYRITLPVPMRVPYRNPRPNKARDSGRGWVWPKGTILRGGAILPPNTVIVRRIPLPTGTVIPPDSIIPGSITLPRGSFVPRNFTLPAGTVVAADFEKQQVI